MSNTRQDEGKAGGQSQAGRPPPPPSALDFLEWPLHRIALEVILGAGGGFLLSRVLPGGEEAAALFVAVGAAAAPVALLLTPRRGSPGYRAIRYGLALAVVVTLVASFVAGPEALLLEELLGLALLILAVGTAGHGALAATVDRVPGAEDPRPSGSGESGDPGRPGAGSP
jgi:hypothetical protein